MTRKDDTAIEQALDALTKNANKKDWANLVKAISVGIIIVCLGVPAFALGAGYYVASQYLYKNKCQNQNENFINNTGN